MVDVTTAFKNECEANVGTYKFGKVKVNLIDNNPASWEIGEYSSSNGTKIDTANMTRLSSLSKCEPNKQYTVSLNNSNFRLRLAYFNDSQTYISSSATLTGGTITTPANTKYIGATLWNNANTYTGTNINLQNSTDDKLVSYNLEGQTNQEGTPTPTTPIDIKNVRGSNELWFSYFSYTANGLTGSLDENTLVVTGTNTKTDANWGFLYPGLGKTRLPNFVIGKKYTVSSTNQYANANVYFQINYYAGSTQKALFSFSLNNKSLTFTVPNDFTSLASPFVGIVKDLRDIDYTTNLKIEERKWCNTICSI